MIEKFKAVNNPLTIIALFAGLAEIAFTVSLGLVDKPLQTIFIWFVMVFPTLLVILFFTTLNFNPRVLYSPSDYKDEENFVNALIGTKTVVANLSQATQQFDEVRKLILQQSEIQRKAISNEEQEIFIKLLEEELKGVTSRLESVRVEAESVASDFSDLRNPQSSIQAKTLNILHDAKTPLTLTQISQHLGMSKEATNRMLTRLVRRGLLIQQTNGSENAYSLNLQTNSDRL